MAVVFPVVSFVCAAFLAVFIPVRRIRISVPNLAIVLWLAGTNIVHGINAVVWDGNVDIRVPVWCDIVTKLMLGANIALPGAFLCISRQLELVSSPRKISLEKNAIRNRTILELVLCYLLPIIYMSSHLVAQDHRFDLVKDLGCSASIHPSTFAFAIIWIPPLILCSISFILCGISIHHACRINSSQFAIHLESRSTLSSSMFIRRLTICMTMTVCIGLISIFSFFVPTFLPWVSWDSVHAQISQINVVTSSADIKIIQLAWWSLFALSILYIFFTFTLGQETRDAFKWICEQVTKERELPKFSLPVYNSKKTNPKPEMVFRSSSLSKPHPRPLTIELRSGWDDMLDKKTPKRFGFSRPTSKSLSPSTRSSSTRSVTEDDQAFMASTLSYLGSPTAKSLGIPSPSLQVPPPVVTQPPRSAFDISLLPPKPASPPPVPSANLNRALKAVPAGVPTDVDEATPAAPTSTTISAILEASWPVPPSSPTPSQSPSRHSSTSRSTRAPSRALSGRSQHSKSRSNSPTSSVDDHSVSCYSPAPSTSNCTFGYPLYPTITPPHLRTRPFEGSSIESLGSLGVVVPLPGTLSTSQASPTTPTTRSLRSALKRPSIKNLRRSWSKERIGQTGYPAEVIHMTVVQETV